MDLFSVMFEIILTTLVATSFLYMPVLAGLLLRRKIHDHGRYAVIAKFFRGAYLVIYGVLVLVSTVGILQNSSSGREALVSFAFLIGVCVAIALPAEIFLFVCRLVQK